MLLKCYTLLLMLLSGLRRIADCHPAVISAGIWAEPQPDRRSPAPAATSAAPAPAHRRAAQPAVRAQPRESDSRALLDLADADI